MEIKSPGDHHVIKKYLPFLRLGVQGDFAFFYLLVGYRFYFR